MRWLMGLMLLLTAAFASPASARPSLPLFEFQQGKTLGVQIIGCDTYEQTRTLMDVWGEEGWDAYLAKKTEFNRTRNRFGQPSCGIVRAVLTPIKLYNVYNVFGENGKPLTLYLIKFQFPNGMALYTISPFPMVIGVGA